MEIVLGPYGLSVHGCMAAAQILAGEGIDCEVIDLRAISPMDSATELASVKNTGKMCIVHEDILTSGVGAELAAIIAKVAVGGLDGLIYRLAAY